MWFNSLSARDRFTLGDHLIVGCFNWRLWLESEPSEHFLRGVEEARLYWETTGEDL